MRHETPTHGAVILSVTVCEGSDPHVIVYVRPAVIDPSSPAISWNVVEVAPTEDDGPFTVLFQPEYEPELNP